MKPKSVGRLIIRRWVLRCGRPHLWLLTSTAAILLTVCGCGGGDPPKCAVPAAQNPVPNVQPLPPGAQRIQHVVVVFQENRTPDNLFHDPVLIARGADIASSGLNSQGQTVQLTSGDLSGAYDLDHAHRAFVAMYDCGKMDGADRIKVTCYKGGSCPSNAQFAYVDPAQVQPYFQLAEQYTFADRMFQTNQGPSFPAHQFIISGTSAPTTTSNLFAAENTSASIWRPTGCIAPAGTTVKMIDPSGNEFRRQYPCFEHPTLSDLLDAQGISWRYYTPSEGSIWTGPNAISHICKARVQNGRLACTGELWSNVVIPPTQLLSDITNDKLPSVTWVMPDGRPSDHAYVNDGSGPSWVASIVNAIGNSSYWSNTAILITWDDWGGWYDHVAPPIINSYEYGFRVPMLVVSPFAKPAYISHVTHDFGSILKFIEQVYGLPSLGYADALADNLSDCFDFNQQPLRFRTISAPLRPEHFLNDRRSPTDPDDD